MIGVKQHSIDRDNGTSYSTLNSTSSLSGSIDEKEMYRRADEQEIYLVPTSASSGSNTVVQSSSLDSFDDILERAPSSDKKSGSPRGYRSSNKKKRKSYESREGINNENSEPNSVCLQDFNVADSSSTASAKKLRFKDALTGALSGAFIEANMCIPPLTAPAVPVSQPTFPTAKANAGKSGLPRFQHQTRSATSNSQSIQGKNIQGNAGRAPTPQSEKKRSAKGSEPSHGPSQSQGGPGQGQGPGQSQGQGTSAGAPLTPKRNAKFFFNSAQHLPSTSQAKDSEWQGLSAAAAASASASASGLQSAPNSSSKITSVSNALMKRLRKTVVRTPSSEVVKGFFDTAFSVTEDKVNNILSNLKVKSKWDLKEKNKKQEVVIKELRESVAVLLAEVRSLRDNCLAHEGEVTMLLRESLDEFQETTHTISSLRVAEDKLRKELARYQEELSETTSSMQQIKKDHSPLKRKVKDYESALKDLQLALLNEQALRQAACAERASLEIEYEVLKNKSEETLKNMRDQCDRRQEQAVQGYRDEVASLRAELSKRQSDVDRVSFEKSDSDRQKSLLHAELMLSQSKAREADAARERAEKDVQRIAEDLAQLKEQLMHRDADLRSTLNSLAEIQRQASEEKAALRAEINNMHSRCQQLEDERLAITTQLATKKEEVLSLGRDLAAQREFVVMLDAKLVQRETEVANFKDLLMQLEIEKELRARCEIREEAERRERIAANAQLMAVQVDCSNRIREVESMRNQALEGLQAELTAATAQKDVAVAESRRQADVIMGLENEVHQMSHALEHASTNHEAVEKLGRVSGELEIVKRRLREVSEEQQAKVTLDAKRIEEYEEKIRQGEVQRRKLHNLVQELRGNIRVFARVRPYLPSDLPGGDLSCPPESVISLRQDLNSLRIARAASEERDRAEDHTFSFDRVFGPSTSQETLFTEVSEFVQSALDGYNVCLFSYGQTGSGKTHTMQGSGTGSMRGIIPRAMQQVGHYKNELEAKGWEYFMEVSFVEIYNEDIRDLLRSGQHEPGRHEIKKDAQGKLFISDVTLIAVDPNDVAHVENIMELAARHRSVCQTGMNERSSRSHSVFTLHLKAAHAGQGIVLNGTLSLVDLAGSERVDRSMVTGAQLKETVAINKSLSALADVFVAIANKQPHIPFRNSKLTYLLQPALSGDGKTLMLVNLSPTEESFYESLCSLRLAKQVNQCELGKPKKQLRDLGQTPSHGSYGQQSHSQSHGHSHSLGQSVAASPQSSTPTPTPPHKRAASGPVTSTAAAQGAVAAAANKRLTTRKG